VSVVLPTYQRAPLIGRALASILTQGRDDLEVIVVDDGSTDGTAAVVEGHRDRFPAGALRYIATDRGGAGAARNVGIREARAPFVAFQDSDDEWLPGKLQRQMAAFDRLPDDVGVVYSDMWRVHEDGRRRYHASPTVSDRLVDPERGRYQVLMLGIQSTVIRREHLEALGGFDETMPAFEDLELFVRLSRRTRFHHIRRPLVLYHETDGISADRAAIVSARRRLLELYGDELAEVAPAFLAAQREWLAEREAWLASDASPADGGPTVRSGGRA
jgi:glycosyltransferase involved in cell wall biosynthesis